MNILEEVNLNDLNIKKFKKYLVILRQTPSPALTQFAQPKSEIIGLLLALGPLFVLSKAEPNPAHCHSQ